MWVLNMVGGLLVHSREWLDMGKISKCCTDAHSWLLGFQLIKWSFCKPIDHYSCRFSIEGASIETAYSELMRKVLIKLAICSIAFTNGKIAAFLLLILLLLSSPAVMGVTEAVTVSTVSSVFQHVHSRLELCFMRYSWHAQLNACNACLWKYLSEDLCLYWMQLCLQFCPGDIDLAMLPEHILSFQAFNLFWSTWRAQELGLPYIVLVPLDMIFRLHFWPSLLCRCKTFVWTHIFTRSQGR